MPSSTKIGALEAVLELDSKNLELGLKQATASLSTSAAKMNKSFDTVGRTVKGLGGLIRGAFVFAIGSAVAGQVQAAVRLADQYKVLQARLQNATKATGDYVKVSGQLAQISREVGTSLEAPVSLFQRLSISASTLGASTDEMVRFTEAALKVGTLSGASGEELSNATRQLSQALGGGIVRAEEFNSIIENTPYLAAKIAEGMGLTTSELRKQMLAGRLLSKDVFQALISQSEAINQEFARFPQTAERGFNALSQSVQVTIGKLDAMFNVSGKIGEAFAYMAKSLDSNFPALQAIAVALRSVYRLTMGMLNGIEGLIIGAVGAIAMAVDAGIAGINKLYGLIRKVPGLEGLPSKGLPGGDFKSAKSLSALSEKKYKASLGYYKSAFDFSIPKAKPLAAPVQPKALFGSGAGGASSVARSAKGGRSDRASQQDDGLSRLRESLAGNLGGVSVKEAREQEALINKLYKERKIGLVEYNALLAGVNKSLTQSVSALSRDPLQRLINDPLDESVRKMEDLASLKVSDSFEENFRAAQGIIESTKTSQQKLNEALASYQDLLTKGFINQTQYDAASKKAKDDLLGQSTTLGDLEQAARRWGSTFEDSVVNSIRQGKLDFKDFAASVLEDLSRMILRLTIIEPIAKRLQGAFQGGKAGSGGGGLGGLASGLIGSALSGGLNKAAGGIGKAAGGLFGGIKSLFGFAEGGNPPVGRLSLVGENGPELIAPRGPASVLSNQVLQAMANGGGGGGGVTQNFYINATDVQTFRQQLARESGTIGAIALQKLQRNETRAGRRGPLDR